LTGPLDCPFLCVQCWQGLWIVHACVSSVASASGLSILVFPVLTGPLDCPFLCVQCCQCLWIVHSCVSSVVSASGLSILVCPVLTGPLDCPFLINPSLTYIPCFYFIKFVCTLLVLILCSYLSPNNARK
jgi:hypothetical protein